MGCLGLLAVPVGVLVGRLLLFQVLFRVAASSGLVLLMLLLASDDEEGVKIFLPHAISEGAPVGIVGIGAGPVWLAAAVGLLVLAGRWIRAHRTTRPSPSAATASGGTVRQINAIVYHVEDGRITQYWMQIDRAGLAAQLPEGT